MRISVDERLEKGRILGHPWDNGGLSGAFVVQGPCGVELRIVSSDGRMRDAQLWDHVSVSTPRRAPNWQEMCFVKDLFWTDDECVVQFHPTKQEYVNNHPNVLHMWKHIVEKFPTPPSILVGVKQDGTYANAKEAAEGFKRARQRGEL